MYFVIYLCYFFMHFIHLLDWVSVIVAKKDKVDPDDISLIHSLKDQLKVI